MLGSYHIEVLVNTIHINIQVTFTTLFFSNNQYSECMCLKMKSNMFSHQSVGSRSHLYHLYHVT